MATIQMHLTFTSGDLHMLRLVARTLFAASFICLFAGQTTLAQAHDASKTSSHIHVNAPLAQSIVVKEHHDDIVKLGLHAVPPGSTDNVIIASDAPTKIGKKSSAEDLEKLAQNKPIAVPLDKSKTFDLLIPITDSGGGDLNGGFVVMEVPYSKAANEEEAFKIGVRIRDEPQHMIPSKAALYQQQ
jgi:hypothetical protein